MFENKNKNLTHNEIKCLKYIVNSNSFSAKIKEIGFQLILKDLFLLIVLPMLTLIAFAACDFEFNIVDCLFLTISILLFLCVFYNDKQNKKYNKTSQDTFDFIMSTIFKNIDKNHLTIISLQEILKDLDSLGLIFFKNINAENLEYDSNVSIKDFRKLLKSKIKDKNKKIESLFEKGKI